MMAAIRQAQFGNTALDSRISLPKIAIMNSLGDFSFNSYCWHVSEALGKQGWSVDLYTNAEPGVLESMPRVQAHKRHLLWGSFIRGERQPNEDEGCGEPVISGGNLDAELARRVGNWENLLRRYLRPPLLTHQTLWTLRQNGIRILWTQWPEPEPYLANLWDWARRYGMLTVHTVHNVLPHEVRPGDRERYQRAYASADLLLVHSEESRKRLLTEFPIVDPAKTVMHRMGLYQVYPRNTGKRRSLRQSWGLNEDQCVFLVCGLIRPYKNVDVVIEAFQKCSDPRAILLIAGREMGFPESDPAEPLKQTRKKIRDLGLSERVKLWPGYLSAEEMSGLLEASDVLMLPYKEGYGSGLLLLGMTFGKQVVTTMVGGAQEYLEEYQGKVLLPNASVGALVDAWPEVLRRWENRDREKSSESAVWYEAPESLQWDEAVKPLIEGLKRAWVAKSCENG